MPMRDTDFEGAAPVDGYGPGFFRVAGHVLHGPVIVTAEGARPWGGLDDVAALAALGGRIDVLLTHSPPRGLGDGDDLPHQGFTVLHEVIERLRPTWLLHGHIHPYGQPQPDRVLGDTTIRNVVPYRLMEIEPVMEEVPDA